MVRGSKKCESSEKEAKTKLKKAIEARNTEGARIYAQVGPQRFFLLHVPRHHHPNFQPILASARLTLSVDTLFGAQ
jgi:hypothetical protein